MHCMTKGIYDCRFSVMSDHWWVIFHPVKNGFPGLSRTHDIPISSEPSWCPNSFHFNIDHEVIIAYCFKSSTLDTSSESVVRSSRIVCFSWALTASTSLNFCRDSETSRRAFMSVRPVHLALVRSSTSIFSLFCLSCSHASNRVWRSAIPHPCSARSSSISLNWRRSSIFEDSMLLLSESNSATCFRRSKHSRLRLLRLSSARTKSNNDLMINNVLYVTWAVHAV